MLEPGAAADEAVLLQVDIAVLVEPVIPRATGEEDAEDVEDEVASEAVDLGDEEV